MYKFITIMLFFITLPTPVVFAQNKTAESIENAGEVVEKTNETVKEAGKLFKSVFGKKKKNKEEKKIAENPPASNSKIENPVESTNQNTVAINTTQKLKPGSIHPNAVVLDVDRFSSFNDGAAIVTKGMLTALINSKGQIIAPYNQYNFFGQYMAEGLNNGIFITLSTNSASADNGFVGFVNSDGKEIPFKGTNYVSGVHLGKYLIRRDKNITSFYDKSGKVFHITDYAQNSKETAYSKGCTQNSFLFLFYESNSKYGYKNINDKIVMKPEWDEAHCFQEGTALVGKKNEFGEMKYGFIDTTGKIIVPLMFSKKPEDFSDGLAKVYSNEKTCSSCTQYHYSYINKKGDFVINSKDLEKPGMSYWPFVYGYAFSYLDVLDKQGTVISATDFLISFGIPKEIILNSKNISALWDYKSIINGKMMVSFKGSEGHTYRKYHALLDLVNKKTLFYWYADAQISAFDSVSGLALVEEFGDKIRSERKRIGYINEDGIFMIVKGEKSKW